jgi:hypothetical protein
MKAAARAVPSKRRLEVSTRARSVATSKAALLLTPIDTGTSEVMANLSPLEGHHSLAWENSKKHPTG